jgi:hypothetical protein
MGFAIVLEGPERHSVLGATRFGGDPDLPESVGWPASDGASTFYAQIDLSDLSSQGHTSALPRSGLLSFFAGPIEGAAEPIVAHVVYAPAGTVLTRRAAPAFADGCARLEPVRVRFSPTLCLPVDDLDFLEAAEGAASDGDLDSLIAAVEDRPAGSIGMLLGCAVTGQEDLQAAIALDALGRSGQDSLLQWRTWADWTAAKRMESRLAGGSIYRPWSDCNDDDVRWLQANRDTVDDEIRAWTHLLQIKSNPAMRLWINDADPIFFFARGDAVARKDFRGVRARATQS